MARQFQPKRFFRQAPNSLLKQYFEAREIALDLDWNGLAESVTDPEASFAQSVIEQVEIAAKYSGYIDRQRDEVSRAAYYEYLRLPEELDYMQVSALSIEARQKLNRHRPETLGLASRISGITPATISLLLIHLKRSNFKQFSDPGKADLSEAGEG